MSWNIHIKISMFFFKTDAHGTVWNLHIEINLKINVSETNEPIRLKFIQGGREINAIIVTCDYLCYEEPKSPFCFNI